MVGREEEPKVRRVPRAEVPEGGGGGVAKHQMDLSDHVQKRH